MTGAIPRLLCIHLHGVDRENFTFLCGTITSSEIDSCLACQEISHFCGRLRSIPTFTKSHKPAELNLHPNTLIL